MSKIRQKLTQDQKVEILRLSALGWKSRAIAEEVLGRKSRKSTVNTFLAEFRESTGTSVETTGPKVLFLDLEVSASVGVTFPRFKANISPSAVLKEPYLLTAAWCWNGEEYDHLGLHDLPLWESEFDNDILLVERLWELLDEADVVIAHNAGFDAGWCNTRFAYYGMEPPSPYKLICTLKALKKHFKLPSNSLDASTKYFELERKLDNEGISLWVKCMQGDEDAMDRMMEYNIGDIPTLVQLYHKIQPFMNNHPNMALYYNDDKIRCNNCGSENMTKEDGKHVYTNLSKFDVYRCGSCGSVKRDRKNKRCKEQMINTLMNAGG